MYPAKSIDKRKIMYYHSDIKMISRKHTCDIHKADALSAAKRMKRALNLKKEVSYE